MWKNSKKLIAGVALAVVSVSTTVSADTLYFSNDRNMERGMEALMQGELQTASKYLGRAAKTDLGKERLVPVLSNLCAVDYALGKLDSAQEACDRAIQEDRHFWRAYVNRGNVHKAKGHFEEAREDYTRALRINPNGQLPKDALARLMEEQPKYFAEAK